MNTNSRRPALAIVFSFALVGAMALAANPPPPVSAPLPTIVPRRPRPTLIEIATPSASPNATSSVIATPSANAATNAPKPSASPSPVDRSTETTNVTPPKTAPIKLPSATPTPTPTPTPDPAETKKKILELAKELASSKRDVRQIIVETNRKFSDLGKNADPELDSARLSLIEAMEKAKMWQQMLLALGRFRSAEPQFPRPAWNAEAMIGLSSYKNADNFLSPVAKKYPQDPEVDVWRAAVFNAESRWPDTLTAANAALSKASLPPATKFPSSLKARANFYKYHALLYQNKLPEAENALSQALALDNTGSDYKKALRVLASAKLDKFIHSNIYQETIPLGIFHLFTSDGKRSLAGSVCSLNLTTLTTAPRSVKVDVQISGVTEAVSRTLLLLPGQSSKLEVTPPLKFDFDPAALRAERPAQLMIQVTDQATNTSLVNWSFPVKVLPFDSLPFSIKTAENEYKNRYEFLGAWITPNSKAVEEFLTAAKERVPGKAFTGPFGPSLPQVKAMFDQLKSTGVTYVMDPSVFSDFGHIQRTRLPREVLANHNAQCVEGSLLFASLMESIGLNPFIVHVPGHVFVGWEPTKPDHAPEKSVYYLETTSVGTRSFEEALAGAWGTVQRNEKSGGFNNGSSFILKVSDMRKLGVTPQPNQ